MEEKRINDISVKFSYCAPKAKNVCLAGEFDNWDTQSILMKKGNRKDWIGR